MSLYSIPAAGSSQDLNSRGRRVIRAAEPFHTYAVYFKDCLYADDTKGVAGSHDLLIDPPN